MDQLDKLSLSELIKLNVALQEEITRRLVSLNEENLRCIYFLSRDYYLVKQDSAVMFENRDVSVKAETPTKQSKNQGWINTGKLIATVIYWILLSV